MADKLLTIEDLSVSYATPRGWLRAVDRLSLSIARGEALGLVGESGSGKSSVVLAILGLLGPGARMHATRAVLGGADLLREAAALRGLRIGAVFQDPSAALNPALPVGIQVIEPMLVHRRMSRAAAMQRGTALLAELGIVRAAEMMRLYPHQLSGGMKQRAMIATALAAEPDLLLLDEPTTALDVTVEAQILDLLESLRQRRGLAMLLVSHNLGIVDRICDRITVLYAGRTVETGSATDVLAAARASLYQRIATRIATARSAADRTTCADTRQLARHGRYRPWVQLPCALRACRRRMPTAAATRADQAGSPRKLPSHQHRRRTAVARHSAGSRSAPAERTHRAARQRGEPDEIIS